MWFRAAAVITLALLAASAGAATPLIHVRGAAKIAAAASASDDAVVLSGAIVDDTGRPVGGASLHVRGIGPDGSNVPLPPLGACAEPPAQAFHSGRRAEQIVQADPGGRFCVRTDPSGLAAFAVGFNDEHGLFDAAEENVGIDRSRRAVELRVLPATPTFELERERQRLQVSARAPGPLASAVPALPLAAYALTANAEILVAQGACPLNGNAELDFATTKLTGPGPVELALRFAGSGALQPAETRRRVLATARVTLALSRAPAAADPSDGIALDVALGSAAGAVESGSVEARLDGQTVGIAKVEHGAARVVAQFPRRGPSERLELRYLPTEPWWRPADALGVDVSVLARSRFSSLAWLAALGALAVWLVWGWRRPPRAERARINVEGLRTPVAGVHVVRREDGYVGWHGLVRDAHDERPVAEALVSLVESTPDRRVLARATSDPQGRFELHASGSGALELVVTARLHSDFSCPAPPHGEVRVELVSRRRSVLGRLVRWAERRGAVGRTRAEPTPGDVKRHGRRSRKEEVVAWASAVEAAAYGPEPVDETIEHDVGRREPPDPGDPSEPQR
ncbi:MAG TPA: hypothetical protein VGQ57_13430 [Polyangiaceae bacterium]|nr:hypothetical protein [Polyangiaceae bacterium]